MKKLSRSSILLLFFFSNAYAETFGHIVSLGKDNVFLLAQDETASAAKKGDFLEPGSQLLVEEGSWVLFSDYFDNNYQLSSGGLVKFREDGMELTRGSLKIKSIAANPKTITIDTPNSIIKFSESEGLISYDPALSKTEVSVFDGLFDFKSKTKLGSSVIVRTGQFSSITSNVQMGMATIPSKITKDYLNRSSLRFAEEPSRAMASKPEGKIIVIKAAKHKSSKTRKRSPSSEASKPKDVPIKIFGSGSSSNPN